MKKLLMPIFFCLLILSCNNENLKEDILYEGNNIESNIIERYKARKDSYLFFLSNYFNYLVKNAPMISSIRNHIDEDYYKNQLKSYNPFRILFIGSSSTNLQWNPKESMTCYTNGMNGKPLGMDNENHWTYHVWNLFNYSPLQADGSRKKNGSMEIMKISQKDTKGIIVNGSFEYNRFENGQWLLGDCLGYKDRGVHEFAFFKNRGDYVEFDMPNEAIGFDIIVEMFEGTRTNGIITLSASDNVELDINGVKETISFAQPKSNYHIIRNNPNQARLKVRLTNKAANKWMGVWGVYYWTDIATIPSNIGISGGNVDDLLESFSYTAMHQAPDIIFWQPTINNDGEIVSFMKKQNELCEKLKALTNKIVVVLQHCVPAIVESGKLYQWQEKRQYAIEIAIKNGFPIIDWGGYLYEKYGPKLSKDVLPDGIHVGNKEWIEINRLFSAAFAVNEESW